MERQTCRHFPCSIFQHNVMISLIDSCGNSDYQLVRVQNSTIPAHGTRMFSSFNLIEHWLSIKYGLDAFVRCSDCGFMPITTRSPVPDCAPCRCSTGKNQQTTFGGTGNKWNEPRTSVWLHLHCITCTINNMLILPRCCQKFNMNICNILTC